MSAFGVKILTRILIPYTFGIYFAFFWHQKTPKERESCRKCSIYFGGIVFVIRRNNTFAICCKH